LGFPHPRTIGEIMPTITLPSIRWGKRKQRSQMCLVFTDDGRLITIELEVLRGCVNDDATRQAFLIDAANQYMGDDRHWYQVLGERSTIPICMLKPTEVKNLEDLINQIFHESQESAKLLQYERAGQNSIMDKILWIVAIPCSALLIAFAIIYFI